MMKKLFLPFAAVLMLAACNHQPAVETFNINVDLANSDGQTLYLQRAGLTLDSAVIENWKATFATPVCADNEMYAIMLKDWRRPFAFFVDNVETSLEGDSQNPNSIVVKGSETHARWDAFVEGYNALEAQSDSISQQVEQAKQNGDQALAEQLQQQYDDAYEIQKMYCFDYIWENPTDPVAHYVLYRYKWHFGPCEIRYMIDNIHQADSTISSNNLKVMEEYVEKLESTQAGKPIIDFTQNDADGNPVTLSELAAGKLLLVDFWASWCPDCRKENPNVVAAYNQFHEQGFDVLGVSFDTKKEAWLAAIEKDGLTWTHVSDLQGWNNAAGQLYSIAFIPLNALIKDGMIVARNLEGEELMAEIERQLK